MLLKLVPEKTSVPFTKWRRIALVLSAIMVVGSIAAVATLGLNLGVDFRGGLTLEAADDEPVELGAVRDAIGALGFDSFEVKEINDFAGGDPAVSDTIGLQAADAEEAADESAAVAAEDAQQDAAERVEGALRELFGEGYETRKVEVVGPTVSGELIQRGVTAVAIAIVAMLAYIWVRFDWQLSIGAIVALVHDVIITLGVFALTRLEFNLSIIAALLTIVGYSMNDTVVVYDRVRENLRKFKKLELPSLLDLSINDTLSRTVMTSVTTLIALVALFAIGGEVLRGFTFAMIWGVLIGTYSSIFVASPLLLATGVKRDWSEGADGAPATSPAA
ncbi:MAG: protein translocase subunit SecF [Parvularculaceae bacterium]